MEDDFPENPLQGFSFSCRRSGNCCAQPGGRVRLEAKLLPKIAAHLGLKVEGLLSLYLVQGPDGDFLAKEAQGGACPFLASKDGKASCKIYPFRPEHCRSFPFREDVLKDSRVLASVLRFCPGLRPCAQDNPPPEDSRSQDSSPENPEENSWELP